MSSSVPGSYNSLLDAIPELASLQYPSSRLSAYLGGRNFTYGCLQAVNESLQIVDGFLAFKDVSYFDDGVTISQVQDAATYGSLCTNNGTAARVVVPYRWCQANCSGWEASHWNSLQQWIGPLVQFILPCLAFCLSVPRSWKVRFPEWIIDSRDKNLLTYIILTYLVKFPIAFAIVFWDTIFWLCTCFALAGPMLLSAVYEYTWDGIILDFLQPRVGPPPRVPPVTRARLLLATVVGNIKLDPLFSSKAPTLPGQNTSPSNGIWLQVMGIAEELLPAPRPSHQPDSSDSKGTAPSNTGHRSPRANQTSTAHVQAEPEPGYHDRGPGPKIGPDLKLTALLNAQSSFGGAVGAPVVFFIGSFIYNIVEAETRLGDNDTAHALAFGMWWMTISHLAVISCAVLASNNPSALQGFIGKAKTGSQTVKPPVNRKPRTGGGNSMDSTTTSKWTRIIHLLERMDILEHAFDSTFEPISLWKRGPNKRLWIDKAMDAYEEDRHGNKSITLDELHEALRLGFWTRVVIWLINLFILIGAPCALAFATSYTTPVAGLGCRSLTHLVYYITQVIQMLLWSWNVDLSRAYPTSKRLHLCRGLQIIFGSLAVFAAIGGTLMQIMGVYRNCLCKMPTWAWLQPDSPQATVGMSYSTAQSVPVAEVWKWTGAFAAGTLALVAALAWWHQRRLRRKFLIVADNLQTSEVEMSASDKGVLRNGNGATIRNGR